MSRLSLILLFALISLALAAPYTSRQAGTVVTPEPEASEEESMEPSPSSEVEDDDEVCVDEKYLLSRHTRRELVHATPLLAATLCPGGALPCGTANHMVRVGGKSVSYRELCETRVCEKKNLLVNSVLSHVWKEIDHDGVTMTMFDARHPELPQKVLHWSVAQKRRIFG